MIDPLTPADAVRALVQIGLAMLFGYALGFRDGRKKRDLSTRWARRALRKVK